MKVWSDPQLTDDTRKSFNAFGGVIQMSLVDVGRGEERRKLTETSVGLLM